MNKRMSHLIAMLALCAMLFSLPGCGGESDPQTFSRATQPVTWVLEVFPGIDPELNYVGEEERKARVEYAQQIIEDAGFSIDLQLIRLEDHLADAQDILQARAELLEQPNVVMNISPGDYEALRGMGALGEVVEAAQQYAPTFFARASEIERPEENDCFPASIYDVKSNAYHGYAMLVNKAIYAEYGTEVNTWSDYLLFLDFVGQAYPDMLPGVMPTDDIFKYVYAPAAIDLPLIEMGYVPLNETGGGCIYLDSSGELVALEDIPGVIEIIEAAAELGREGLLTFTSTASSSIPLYLTASLITHDFAFLNDPERFHRMMGEEVAPADYDIVYFYDGILPGTGSQLGPRLSPEVFVTGKQGECSELFRFLEALYSDQDFYNQIMLGIEGEDYERHDDGTVSALPTELEYFSYPLTTIGMTIHEPAFSRDIHYSWMPLNYNEASSSGTGVDNPRYNALQKYVYRELLDHQMLLSERILTVTGMMLKAYLCDGVPIETLEATLQGLPDAQVAIELLDTLYEKEQEPQP